MRQVHNQTNHASDENQTPDGNTSQRIASTKKSLADFFADVKKGSPLEIAILFGGIALVAAVIALVVHLATGTSTENSSSDVSVSVSSESYDPAANSLNIGEYEGVVLQENKADAKYLTETLFVGDSNTNRMIVYGFASLENCIGVDSMSVSGVSGVNSVYFTGYSSPVTIPRAIGLMQPKRILLTFGTNNTLGDTASFKKQYTAMVENIIDAWPYADIIINTVPPFGTSRTNMNLKQSTVDSFNKSLLEIAQELDDKYEDITIRFLNSAEVLKGSNGYMKDNYIDTDGVHLTRAGMEALFDYISSHAMEETEDRRPALKTIPNHKAAPLPVISEDPLAASSSSSSTVVTTTSSVSYSYDSSQGSVSGATTIGASSIAFTVTPASGYQIASVSASGGSVGGGGNSYTLQPGGGPVTVYVTFAAIAPSSSSQAPVTSSEAPPVASSEAPPAASSEAPPASVPAETPPASVPAETPPASAPAETPPAAPVAEAEGVITSTP